MWSPPICPGNLSVSLLPEAEMRECSSEKGEEWRSDRWDGDQGVSLWSSCYEKDVLSQQFQLLPNYNMMICSEQDSSLLSAQTW